MQRGLRALRDIIWGGACLDVSEWQSRMLTTHHADRSGGIVDRPKIGLTKQLLSP